MPRDRQLRLLHLQPRPVPGRARGGDRGRAQRQAEVAELLERGADRLVVSPGPCTPAEAGISGEAIRAFAEAGHAGARRLPRPPGDGRGLRRPGRPGRAGPRQGRRDRARRQDDLRRAAEPMVAGRYHSLVADPDLPAELELSASARRRRDGRSPPRAAGRGRPVPSRVGPHPDGQAPARRTSSIRRQRFVAIAQQTSAAEARCPTTSSAGRSTRSAPATTSPPTTPAPCSRRSWRAGPTRSRPAPS